MIVLSETAQAALLMWGPISLRLDSACVKGVIVNLIVIVVYAPTLDAKEDVKNSFYDGLQDTVVMLIVAGDWNARPGPVDMTTRHILEKFALGSR